MKNLRLLIPIMMIAMAIFISSCEKEKLTPYPGTIIKNDTTYVTIYDTIYVGEETVNYALEFNGVDQRVKYPTDASQDIMNGATDYTIEAWVKPNAEDFHNELVMKRWYQFALTLYKNDLKKVYFTHYSNDGTKVFVNTIDHVIKVGEWNHIAVINNSSTNELKIYVNGVDVTLKHYDAKPLESAPGTAANFYVGQYLNASIDEVRVIKEAVDPSELRTSMLSPNYKSNSNTAILMHFDEGSGTTTRNEANCYNAEILNGAVFVEQ